MYWTSPGNGHTFPWLKICARFPVWRSVQCSFDFKLGYNLERWRTTVKWSLGCFAGKDLGNATVRHFVRLCIPDWSEWWESRHVAQLMLALKCTLPTWIFHLPFAAAVVPLETWSMSHNSEVNVMLARQPSVQIQQKRRASGVDTWTSVLGTQPCSCQDRRNDHSHAATGATFLSLSFAVTCSAVGLHQCWACARVKAVWSKSF